MESLQAGKYTKYNTTEYTTSCDMEALQAGKYTKYNTTEYTTSCDMEALQAGKDIKYNTTEYTTPCDMESLQAGKDFLPNYSVSRCGNCFSRTGNNASSETERPFSPLLIGLGVQLHRLFKWRFMVDTLNKWGLVLLFRSSEV